MQAAANFGIATGALDERADWETALTRIVSEGWRCVELTAITEDRFETLDRLLLNAAGILDSFDRVTLHAPVTFETTVEHVGRNRSGASSWRYSEPYG
jgi:hypothetical protein